MALLARGNHRHPTKKMRHALNSITFSTTTTIGATARRERLTMTTMSSGRTGGILRSTLSQAIPCSDGRPQLGTSTSFGSILSTAMAPSLESHYEGFYDFKGDFPAADFPNLLVIREVADYWKW